MSLVMKVNPWGQPSRVRWNTSTGKCEMLLEVKKIRQNMISKDLTIKSKTETKVFLIDFS